MTRKVHLTAKAVILVPVEFDVELVVMADDDTNLGLTAYKWSRGLRTPGANVEDYSITAVTKVGEHNPGPGGLDAAIMDRLDEDDIRRTGCHIDPLSVSVTDSR